MKKLLSFLFVLLVFSFAVPSIAGNIHRIHIFDDQTIAAGESATYPDDVTSTIESIDLHSYKASGTVGLQLVLTGDGTAKGEYSLSAQYDTDFIIPSTASEFFTGFTKTSGGASNGKDSFYKNLEPNRFLKIIITETGGVKAVVVDAWLIIEGDI